jgi:CubicO group peptidase (beta-lactamase class C family)
MPGWADGVTLAQLMHHSSGIPDYIGFLGAHAWPDTTLTSSIEARQRLTSAAPHGTSVPTRSCQNGIPFHTAWASVRECHMSF